MNKKNEKILILIKEYIDLNLKKINKNDFLNKINKNDLSLTNKELNLKYKEYKIKFYYNNIILPNELFEKSNLILNKKDDDFFEIKQKKPKKYKINKNNKNDEKKEETSLNEEIDKIIVEQIIEKRNHKSIFDEKIISIIFGIGFGIIIGLLSIIIKHKIG